MINNLAGSTGILIQCYLLLSYIYVGESSWTFPVMPGALALYDEY